MQNRFTYAHAVFSLFVCSISLSTQASDQRLGVSANYKYYLYHSFNAGPNYVFGICGDKKCSLDGYFTISPMAGINLYQKKTYSNLGMDLSFFHCPSSSLLAINTAYAQNKFYITPEVGMSFYGRIALTYGYKFGIGNEYHTGGRHVVTLRLNFTKVIPEFSMV